MYNIYTHLNLSTIYIVYIYNILQFYSIMFRPLFIKIIQNLKIYIYKLCPSFCIYSVIIFLSLSCVLRCFSIFFSTYITFQKFQLFLFWCCFGDISSFKICWSIIFQIFSNFLINNCLFHFFIKCPMPIIVIFFWRGRRRRRRRC